MKSALLLLAVAWCVGIYAQDRSPDDQPHITPRSEPKQQNPKRSKPVTPDQQQDPTPDQDSSAPGGNAKGESSSRDSLIDEGAPPDRPSSPGFAGGGAIEMRPYDPHKAAKDLEVGQYYLKRKNYRAALDRFNEALEYKPKDAETTFYLAQTQEKLELFAKAYENYSLYLEIIPHGPFEKEAEAGLKRLDPKVEVQDATQAHPPEFQLFVDQGEAALAKNDFSTAYDRFSKALQIAPDDALANFHVAESLQGMERLDEARLFYQKCVQLQPNGSHVHEAKRQIAEINYILGK